MPQRIRTLRVGTESVQGEGSWVEVRRPTVREILQDDSAELTGNARYEARAQEMVSYVENWNWVDDEGHALPLPSDEPGIWQALTKSEIEVLQEAL